MATQKAHLRGHLEPEPLFDQLKSTERNAERIRARGGRVILVRFPTSGALWTSVDERFYPRAEYWDVFAARTGMHMLHFQDVPGLAGFDCPDGSHIDAKDRTAFTEALLDALDERGWLDFD